MWKKALYIATGVILAVATVVTNTNGLSDRNIENYKNAAQMQEELAAQTFKDYQMTDYPVSFFDGTYDYVVTGGAQKQNIKRRKPVLGGFVGTAYEVEGHYEIILPTVEQFSGMVDMISATQIVSTEGNDTRDRVDYGDEEHITTIFHEGFHAWQMSNFEQEIVECLQGRSFADENFGESLIVEEIDNNPIIVAYYEKEMALLKKILLSDSMEKMRAGLAEYKRIDNERKGLLSEDVLILEDYYERIEGTAYYIESKAYEMLKSQEAYQTYYVEPISAYTKGAHKYYSMGMVKCRIMDKINPGWQDTYTFAESLTEVLYQQAE